MNQQEILENNKLIFDFMGCKHSVHEAVDTWEMDSLKYHTSWDWLMPVVEKIEAMGWDTDICFNSNLHACIITKKGEEWGIDIIDDTKLSATYQAVVSFIKQVTTP